MTNLIAILTLLTFFSLMIFMIREIVGKNNFNNAIRLYIDLHKRKNKYYILMRISTVIYIITIINSLIKIIK